MPTFIPELGMNVEDLPAVQLEPMNIMELAAIKSCIDHVMIASQGKPQFEYALRPAFEKLARALQQASLASMELVREGESKIRNAAKHGLSGSGGNADNPRPHENITNTGSPQPGSRIGPSGQRPQG